MDVGHAGLVKLGYHHDMNEPTGKIYTTHMKAIAEATFVITASLIDDAYRGGHPRPCRQL